MADTIGTINIAAPRGWTDSDWQKLIELTRAGMYTGDIAHEIGRTCGSVEKQICKVRKAYGISVKSSRKPSYTDRDDATIIAMWADGKLLNEIGERIGKSGSAIGSRLTVLRQNNPDDPRLANKRDSKPPSRKGGGFRLPKNYAKDTNNPYRRMTARAASEAKFCPSFFDRSPKPHMAGIPFDRLEPQSCRYACNDANIREGEEHLFCGADRVEGKSYCKAHLDICEVIWRPAA